MLNGHPLLSSAFNRSTGGYSVESRRVYLTFKNSPERNSPGLLTLLQRVLFRGSHLLKILLKALTFYFEHYKNDLNFYFSTKFYLHDIVYMTYAMMYSLHFFTKISMINIVFTNQDF